MKSLRTIIVDDEELARSIIREYLEDHPEVVIEDVPREAMERGLREFYPILLENKAKFGVKPTHTLEELLQLHELVPELMQLFLVRVGGESLQPPRRPVDSFGVAASEIASRVSRGREGFLLRESAAVGRGGRNRERVAVRSRIEYPAEFDSL